MAAPKAPGGRPPRRGARTPPGRPRFGRAAQGGEESGSVWMFGLHAVRDALANPRREKRRLIVTPNAQQRLEEAIAAAGLEPEIADPRKFSAPIDPQSVHQGAALECAPLDWGSLEEVCAPLSETDAPMVLLLDRVTDPHNVGAILRSAEVFGARAVIAPHRHSAPETGALAKAASGALERQPYLRVRNLAQAMSALQRLGYVLIGLDGEAPLALEHAAEAAATAPIGLALGAEGPGLRQLTRESCDALARIAPAGGAPAKGAPVEQAKTEEGEEAPLAGEALAAPFASLNVSNAAAVALYAARRARSG